ncbi:hypothetical protein NQ317_008994 [Molorchus minor]|uniref:Uncharacterized protein n=1 Tax=Molorchus minor TaxID=1323400 RepID=A0ABQ9JUI6_9CUCU|nr:hypothetical protein NQ317_008994 [Molorchus minor]
MPDSKKCPSLLYWTQKCGIQDGRTYGRTDRQTDRRTDGQTDRRTDGQTDRRTDGQTDRNFKSCLKFDDEHYVYGKVCGRDCQMVIDTGSYHTIVKPNILAHCKMTPTSNNFILETAGGETLPVVGVHEAEFQLGRTVFRHQVFVANITDDVLMGLELMKKHGFQLNLQRRSIKTGHDEIIISMPRSDEKFGSHCRRTAVVNDDNWETKKLAEEQQKDEDIKPFIAWKEEGTRPEWKTYPISRQP